MNANKKIGQSDREATQQLIRALRDRLNDNPKQDFEPNHKKNLFSEPSLRQVLEKRLDVYLRAQNQVAIRLVETVAKELKLHSYRFQCSASTQESDLWNYPDKDGKFYPSILWKAFTKGGVCCVEHTEKALPDLQLWLRSGLDGLASTDGNSGMNRHPDFVMVVTSPLPIRELWSGQVDHAFVERLLYLDAINPQS